MADAAAAISISLADAADDYFSYAAMRAIHFRFRCHAALLLFADATYDINCHHSD